MGNESGRSQLESEPPGTIDSEPDEILDHVDKPPALTLPLHL